MWGSNWTLVSTCFNTPSCTHLEGRIVVSNSQWPFKMPVSTEEHSHVLLYLQLEPATLGRTSEMPSQAVSRVPCKDITLLTACSIKTSFPIDPNLGRTVCCLSSESVLSPRADSHTHVSCCRPYFLVYVVGSGHDVGNKILILLLCGLF